MRDRYSVVVGLLFAVVIAIALVNTLGSGDEGTLGLDELEPRWALPEFAVPRAAGPLEADANVAQDDCETSRAPCPEDARRDPACGIRTPGAIRVCDFFARPLVLSFWFSRGGGTCVAQQDVVDRAYARYRGRVGFLSLNVRDDHDSVRETIRQRGWRMPVGYDRDGAVAALYRVGICPTFAFVYPGGTLQDASIGELTDAQLDTRVEALLRATRAAEAG
ncbi:MAG TPA: TlpA disulfide reductase family protein [Solirubrobacterales bacterium]